MNRWIQFGCALSIVLFVLVGCGPDPIEEIEEAPAPAEVPEEEEFNPDEPAEDPFHSDFDDPPEEELEKFEQWEEGQGPAPEDSN